MSYLSQVLPVLLQYQVLLKMYHWQTKSYARHKASDELYDRLTDFIDQFVEYGTHTNPLRISKQQLEIYNMTDDNAIYFLQNLYNTIETISSSDKGIKARRDDLIGYIHQTMYLFHLS